MFNLFNRGGFRRKTGKSGFKGSPREQFVVNLGKKVDEKARMLFAIDLKIDLQTNQGAIDHLMEEREEIKRELVQAVEEFNINASNNRYTDFMETLDQEDEHRRNKYGIAQV